MPKTARPTRLSDARARMYHDLIFESAECVFGAKGFSGATMQDIANEAGVSLKTVYASYPGKHELFGEIMRVRGQDFLERVRASVAQSGSALERMDAMARTFVEFLFEHRDWMQIHLRSRIAWSIRPSGDATADLWRRGLADLEAMIEQGIEEGVFHDEDPQELAVLTNTLLKAQVTYAVDRDEFDPEAVFERVLRILRRLLCVEPLPES